MRTINVYNVHMLLVTKLISKIYVHKIKSRNKNEISNKKQESIISVYFICDMFQYKFNFE